MRKLLLAVVCLFSMAGLMIAADVTLVKFDKEKKEITVKDDKDVEKTYKISDKVKIIGKNKDGEVMDVEMARAEKMMSKMAGKMKMDITVEKDEVTEIKLKGGKGGK